MTLAELDHALRNANAELPLIFESGGVPIRGGFHVTEFKHAKIASMTCGGDTDAWEEARIEVMDGHGLADHMPVGRFLSMVERERSQMPDLEALPLTVEFGPDHAGLRLYDLAEPEIGSRDVKLDLLPRGAVCKAVTTVSCCGEGAACCA